MDEALHSETEALVGKAVLDRISLDAAGDQPMLPEVEALVDAAVARGVALTARAMAQQPPKARAPKPESLWRKITAGAGATLAGALVLGLLSYQGTQAATRAEVEALGSRVAALAADLRQLHQEVVPRVEHERIARDTRDLRAADQQRIARDEAELAQLRIELNELRRAGGKP